MAQARRSTDRRRRVLYQTHSATAAPSTPASRRAAEELRAARQPAKAFGSRVGQPLRGRWFSLVPSSTLAMSAVAAVLCVIPISFAFLHHLSFSWPALAYEQAVARPLQINRTDSFATWWTTIVLLLSACVSTLIFQLRRHRSDDFRGHYRLWRMTLIISIAASLHYTVDLVGWLGAVMDLGLGDRAVLSGARWLRIVMDVGGIIIAMQLIAEVARCRAAILVMLTSCACFGFLELAFWNVIEMKTTAIATLITAAPMLGFSCFLLASTIYLRALYRQVVNVANEVSLRHRFSMWLATWRDQDIDLSLPEREPAAVRTGAVARVATVGATRATPAAKTAAAPTTKPSATQQSSEQNRTRTQAAKPAAATNDTTNVTAKRTAEPSDQEEAPTAPKRGLWSRLTGRSDKQNEEVEDRDDTKAEESAETEESPEEQPKRRWFGLRAGKADESDNTEEADQPSDEIENQTVDKDKPAKKPWFSLRLQPKTNEQAEEHDETSASDSPSDAESDEEGEKKPGLFARLFSRNKTDAEETDFEDEEAAEISKPPAARKPGPLSSKAARQSSQQGTQAADQRSQAQSPPAASPQSASDDDINPDDIDWESLSKSERRRLRKQIKRSGRAA